MTVRGRRVENEWSLLRRLAERNPGVIEVLRRETLPDAEVFHLILHRTSALALAPPHLLMEYASHRARFRFPEYYPSMPIEAFLEKPVFHPNIHPENGFVCLWDRFSPGDTIVEAVRKLQKVVAWELWNDRAEHVMQSEALNALPPAAYPFEPARLDSDSEQQQRAMARCAAGPRRRRLQRD